MVLLKDDIIKDDIPQTTFIIGQDEKYFAYIFIAGALAFSQKRKQRRQ